MRLTVNNIRFVKRLEYCGITYSWYVAMKSGRVSDGREYINYDDGGKTCTKSYPKENLPKTVQKYIDSHDEHIFRESDVDYFCEFIIA